MTQIDYKKAFSKLSHIKALSHDQKFDQIVQNLITHTLNQNQEENPRNENEVANRINELYGISIRTPVILSCLDKLLNAGEITKDSKSKQFHVTPTVSNKLRQRIEEGNQLEISVKEKWFEELKTYIEGVTQQELNILWGCLKSYLCSVFEQHGIQTLHLLNPNYKINEDDQKSLAVIIENILNEIDNAFTKEVLTASINKFIANADEVRTSYISQLADSTFTSFALTSDAETVNFLNQRYNDLHLFLDTNFIFGILDLHKNSEDASAREILVEVKKNKLPFRLSYHPETLFEFKRAFDVRAIYVRASKWTRETSRVALAVDGLSPLELLFHKQNIDAEIDPSVFLDKYDHVDLILKDLGLSEFIPGRSTSEDEFVEIESDVEKYQFFYDSIPNRKYKSYLGFKHDVVVLREVRSLNPKKTKFLESNAFFISSDYVLAKFEKKHYKRNWEINYVVSPSVFLQLIRPFIENDYSSNKRFIDTFAIPEFRSFEIDYSTTRSKALQILNDNYHDTSFETKVNILRDQVLLEKLSKVNEDYEKQLVIIESQIAIENQILTKQKAEVEKTMKQVVKEKEKVQGEKMEIEKQKNIIVSEIESKNNELKTKSEVIDNLKLTHTVQTIQQKLQHKKELFEISERGLASLEKKYVQVLRSIEEKLKSHKFYLSLIPMIFFSAIIFLIYKLSWNVMEPYTYVLSVLAILAGYLYFAIKGENINPQKYFDYYKEGITLKVYNEFDFDLVDLESQRKDRINLSKEIDELQKELKLKT